MIRNVFGKAVTKSTVMAQPEHDPNSEVTDEDMASVALALKNTQAKENDEAQRCVERLRNQCAAEDRGRFTVGWIYNASGAAITLVESRDWGGALFGSGSPYPVRIENGQWGMFVHIKHLDYAGSSGAVLFEGYNSYLQASLYWCIAWKNHEQLTQVCVKIVRDVDWTEDEWEKMKNCSSLSQHRAQEDGWFSVISATPPPQVVFEALLTIENL